MNFIKKVISSSANPLTPNSGRKWDSSPIIIIGSGLAGSTLSRCLKEYEIPFILLEKAAFLPRRYYRIALHPWAFRPLLEAINMDEETFRSNTAIISVPFRNRKFPISAIAPNINTGAGSFPCHRRYLDKLLQEDQEISTNRVVQNVTTSSEGIIVQLKDGNEVHGKVLIGADGVHSRVRRQLAPEIKLEVLPYVVYRGKRCIATPSFQTYVADSFKNQTVLQARQGDITLQISINCYLKRHVAVSYAYSRPARDNDPLYRPNRSISEADDIHEKFYEEIENLGNLQRPFDLFFHPGYIRRDKVTHWLMRSSLGDRAQINHLAKKGVLLLGDAAHAMPILGGEGANYAIQDGVDLTRHIYEHGTDKLQLFADAKYETWKRGVEESKTRLADMHGGVRASL